MVAKTREKYVEAFRRLTGRELAVGVVRERCSGSCEEMVDKGVLFEDARPRIREASSSRRAGGRKGSLGKAADKFGMHRNTIARKISEYRIKRSALASQPLESRALALGTVDCLTSGSPFHSISSRALRVLSHPGGSGARHGPSNPKKTE